MVKLHKVRQCGRIRIDVRPDSLVEVVGGIPDLDTVDSRLLLRFPTGLVGKTWAVPTGIHLMLSVPGILNCLSISSGMGRSFSFFGFLELLFELVETALPQLLFAILFERLGIRLELLRASKRGAPRQPI